MARLQVGFIPIEGGHYYKEALEEVTRAEELGFDSVWMEEHHAVTNHYWPSPFPVLAGFATRTSKLRLGTDIAVAAFYHPVRLAEDIAMLDVMSNGRVTLGIAIGYKPDEFALYGVDLEKRGARFEEQLMIGLGLTEGQGLYFLNAAQNRALLRLAGFDAEIVRLDNWLPYPHVLFVARPCRVVLDLGRIGPRHSQPQPWPDDIRVGEHVSSVRRARPAVQLEQLVPARRITHHAARDG